MSQSNDAPCEDCAKLKAEYDNYINGKPGEWYIVQLKNERDQLRAKLDVAIETIKAACTCQRKHAGWCPQCEVLEKLSKPIKEQK